MSIVYINGEYCEKSEAKISINDRGFKYGDGVFETFSFYNQKIYQPAAHFSRLMESLKSTKIQYDISNIESITLDLIKRNNLTDGLGRISITRGEGGRGYLPAENCKPSIIMEVMNRPNMKITIADLWLSSYEKIPPRALPVHAKMMQGMNSTLAKMEANENGCFDALLLGSEGQICETSSGNIFWIKGEKLYTPSLDSGILAGTTRDIIIKLSPFEVVEGRYNLQDLSQADEAFITNVAIKILPIANLKPSGKNYTIGSKTEQIRELLEQNIREKTA